MLRILKIKYNSKRLNKWMQLNIIWLGKCLCVSFILSHGLFLHPKIHGCRNSFVIVKSCIRSTIIKYTKKEKKMFCAIYGSIDCEWILDWCRNENLLFSNVFYFTMSKETENETHIPIHTIKRKILFITSRMSWRQGHIENIVLLICGYFLIRKNLIRIFIWLTMILSDIT